MPHETARYALPDSSCTDRFLAIQTMPRLSGVHNQITLEASLLLEQIGKTILSNSACQLRIGHQYAARIVDSFDRLLRGFQISQAMLQVGLQVTSLTPLVPRVDEQELVIIVVIHTRKLNQL